MTTTQEALKMAIEALWTCMEHNKLHHGIEHNTVDEANKAINACKEALEQQEQEPYRCHWVEKGKGHCERNKRMGFADDYGHPAKQLSDDVIEEIAHECNLLDDYPHDFARAIEKKVRGE